MLAARQPRAFPPVAIVVPARDEALFIEQSLTSLLAQTYTGPFRVILVDDGSQDGTGQIARRLAAPRLTVISGSARPAGWSGKLWAVAQGIRAAGDVDLILLADADIVHAPGHLAALVAKIEADNLDMVSEMVELLSRRFGYSPIDAYMLCSVCADLRISSIVDVPNWVVSFYFPRVVLE